jgi:tetratricopeptide (TPR) repeat protein
VYRFTSPLVRGILLERLSLNRRDNIARILLDRLGQVLPIYSRGIARLYLSVATFIESAEEIAHYEQQLAWWISLEEADELTEDLKMAIGDGRVTAANVVDAVSRNRRSWPPFKCLALLGAIPTDEVPHDSLAHSLALRGEILFYGSRYDGARLDAESALGLAGSRIDRGIALTIRGLCHMYKARYNDAADDLHEAFEISLSDNGIEDAGTVRTLCNLIRALTETKRYAEATPFAELALEASTKVCGEQHLERATAMMNLARLRIESDNLVEATNLTEGAYQIRLKTLGAEHQDTILVASTIWQFFIRSVSVTTMP